MHRYLWFDQSYYLADDILPKCDRMSMAHSLEVRPPFLDHRIVEFAARCPPMKVNGPEQKFILRRLMQVRLPRSVLKRAKKGSTSPPDWLRGLLRQLLMETFTPEAIADRRIFTRTPRDDDCEPSRATEEFWGSIMGVVDPLPVDTPMEDTVRAGESDGGVAGVRAAQSYQLIVLLFAVLVFFGGR